MEKNVFVFQSTTMETESNGDSRDASHEDPICTGNHSGEDIYGEGEEGCQIQEQSQWTSAEVHKLQHTYNTSTSTWSSWSQFYWRALANMEGHPISEHFKRVDQLRLRDENVDAYTHKIFSLGPFNAKPDVLEQDGLKLSAVCGLLGDTPEVFEQLVQTMEKRLPLFNRLYNEEFSQREARTLALLFAVDAVCIVAGLVCKVDAFRHTSIARDVILVENQIPVLAIRHAIRSMNAAQGKTQQSRRDDERNIITLNIVDSLLQMFSPFPVLEQVTESPAVMKDSDERRPLLGFLYDALTRGSFSSTDECYGENDINAEEDPSGKKKERPYSMPGACSLEKHRLKFEALQEADFTGIRFDQAAGTLKLPMIHEMNKGIQTFLLNLVAYEQNIAERSNYKPVTSYVGIMGALIKGEKDVEVLLRSGVIVELKEKNMNAKEQAQLWQKMVSSLKLLPHTRTKADANVEKGVRDFTDRKLNKLRAFIVSLWPRS